MVLVSSLTQSQNLEKYSDIIDIDDDFEVLKSNTDELKDIDINDFWFNNTSEQQFGFIGKSYRRLHLKLFSLIQNPENKLEYLVYGKSMVSNNICDFQGYLRIAESNYIKSSETPNGNHGILAGEYKFFENPNMHLAGIFKGRFVTYWYKNDNDEIKYNDLWVVSAMYNNNQFAGSWTAYAKENSLKANWGNGRVPDSGDLDVGTSEFYPNQKYVSNGWVGFMLNTNVSKDRIKTDGGGNETKQWWE